MIRFILKLFTKIKYKCFPDEHQKTVSSWYKNKGQVFLKYDFNLSQESIVFDIGGFRGDWSAEIHARYSSRIYIFEPVKKFCSDIQSRFNRNNRIHIYNFGLGNKNTNANIVLSSDRSSLYSSHLPASGTYEEIEMRDIGEFISMLEIERIDLMKINIEGGEFDLIPRLIDTDAIRIIGSLLVQFHKIDQHSHKIVERIRSDLNKTHQQIFCYPFVWERWDRKETKRPCS